MVEESIWVASDHVTSNAHIWRFAYRINRQSEVITVFIIFSARQKWIRYDY